MKRKLKKLVLKVVCPTGCTKGYTYCDNRGFIYRKIQVLDYREEK
jgi:hypothetical protein